MSGCAKHRPIDFSSSDAFFTSLNKKKIIEKENTNNSSDKNNLKKNSIGRTEKQTVKKSLLLTLSSYEKKLKDKIGFDEFTILKIFNAPSLKIKHGKIKNYQFHLKSCHLDLFFLNEGKNYKFKYFDIRPSSISSSLNKWKCVKELNNNFILIHDPM